MLGAFPASPVSTKHREGSLLEGWMIEPVAVTVTVTVFRNKSFAMLLCQSAGRRVRDAALHLGY